MPAVIEELVLRATAFTVQVAHPHENQVWAPLHRLHRNNHSRRQPVDKDVAAVKICRPHLNPIDSHGADDPIPVSLHL